METKDGAYTVKDPFKPNCSDGFDGVMFVLVLVTAIYSALILILIGRKSKNDFQLNRSLKPLSCNALQMCTCN